MQKKYAVFSAFFLFAHLAFAQFKYLNLNISMNGGYSQLLHKTDFKTTKLVNLWQFINEHPTLPDLTWEEFLEGYQIKDRFWQPRLGFTGQLTYREWPIKVVGEMMSSSSSYTKISYSIMGGLGKDIYISDSTWYFSFLGGYKYVFKDYGFGSNTLVNSIRLESARKELEQFFAPVDPLGRPSGDLFALRVGFARTLDWYYRWSAGVEAFYELDLTDKIVRNSRMTTYGAQVYLRCKIFGKNVEERRYYPNPAGGRRH